MFYQSSKLHLDIMFVMLCVIARATSHNVSNTSKKPIHQLNNQQPASFIGYILGTSQIEQLTPQYSIDMNLTRRIAQDYQPQESLKRRSRSICTLMSNFLNSFQLKFCRKHQDVLESILPHVIPLTKKECTRITMDLRWNCSSIDLFLDRTNPLALTREAALIRSILNASMMYLVVKICTDGNHRSCGCLTTGQHHSITLQSTLKLTTEPPDKNTLDRNESFITGASLSEQELSLAEFSQLNSGSPLHLSKTTIKRQVCSANVAFASAFVKVFIDKEDQKILTRASKMLNEEHNYATINTSERRDIDSDKRDLAYLRWTKSAVLLHNNHAGRQTLRETLQRQCRCHGVSGTCQFQTCWDRLPDLDAVTSRLRTAYLRGATKVDVRNLGTFEKPDLYLARESSLETGESYSSRIVPAGIFHHHTVPPLEGHHKSSRSVSVERVDARDLMYLNDSPDFCEPLPLIEHLGTRHRVCAVMSNLTTNESKKEVKDADMTVPQTLLRSGSPGSCQMLCCKRGYSSELVLDMVSCNCRFEFCCRVECEHCIRQRVLHHCL